MKTWKKIIQLASIFFIAGLLKAALGFTSEARVMELAKLSIEELISIKVTSVMKTPQAWSESAAAVYVITHEDIRRSGVANIPDILRIIPGVQVAEIVENIFAVSIRGFNDIHADKLLVMVDGRSVYNHIFSGVIWSHLDIFMEDIERIEVIRGPGSNVWGANAVNGVINIITKKTHDTKGTLIEFGGGNPDTISSGVRYGGDLGDDASFRIYARGSDRSNDHLSQPGFDSVSDLSSGMGGFRTDWNPGESDIVSLQGQVIRYNSETEENNPRNPEKIIRTFDQRAWHLLSRWRHTFSELSETAWQIYYQHEELIDGYQYDIFDLDFQHDYEWSARHQISWGLGYRFITDEMTRGLLSGYTFDPVERDQHLFSFFIQDTVQVMPDYLNLTLGSKFEHNDYTGFEIQPGIRMSFTPNEQHTFWGSVSRAVRTPSRIDSDGSSKERLQPKPGGSALTETVGDEDFDSEDLTACEIGYRMKPLDTFWFDLALFYNVYDNLSAYRKEEKESNVWVTANDMEGETYGVEVSIDYRPVKWWRLSGAWSFLEMDMQSKNEQADDLADYVEGSNPRHQFYLHSALNLGRHAEFDLWLRHVDEIGHMRPRNVFKAMPSKTDDYTQLDARLAWSLSENIELSVTARNLGGAHQEFTNYEVEESIFFNVKVEFGK
ncbi:TonB-dependent receptor [Desulfococcaceae bacterium HSG8]|nr:TonB-dependent receptor [Desulfococcaceae bacterium HSG8]